jgi:hypothetical protein
VGSGNGDPVATTMCQIALDEPANVLAVADEVMV